MGEKEAAFNTTVFPSSINKMQQSTITTNLTFIPRYINNLNTVLSQVGLEYVRCTER